jgi:hypothetical protein
VQTAPTASTGPSRSPRIPPSVQSPPLQPDASFPQITRPSSRRALFFRAGRSQDHQCHPPPCPTCAKFPNEPNSTRRPTPSHATKRDQMRHPHKNAFLHPPILTHPSPPPGASPTPCYKTLQPVTTFPFVFWLLRFLAPWRPHLPRRTAQTRRRRFTRARGRRAGSA